MINGSSIRGGSGRDLRKAHINARVRVPDRRHASIWRCLEARSKKGRLLIDSFSPRSIMSTAPGHSASTSQSKFASLFNTALESYKLKTKKDLASHPLLPSLQSCNSPDAVVTVLRDQVPAFNQSLNGDDGLTKWVAPTVNVLYSFSETIGHGVGLVNNMNKVLRCREFLP